MDAIAESLIGVERDRDGGAIGRPKVLSGQASESRRFKSYIGNDPAETVGVAE